MTLIHYEGAMPFRKLVDYTGITIWILTLIFSLGVLYAKQISNTSEIEELKLSEKKIELIEKEIVLFKMQLEYERKAKADMMEQVKKLVEEMQKNNQIILGKLQNTDRNVLKASFQLQAISHKLKIPPVDLTEEKR